MHTVCFARHALILLLILGLAPHANAQDPDPTPAPNGDLRLQLPQLQELQRDIQQELMRELPELRLKLQQKMRELDNLASTRPLRLQDPRQPRGSRIPANWVESTEPFARSFKVGSNAALLVVNVRGHIVVSAGSGDQIDAKATKRAWGSNDE